MGLMSAEVYVRNIEGLDAQLDDIIKAVDQNLESTAGYVFQEAKTTLEFHDKTGNLRKSIKLRKSKFEDGGYIVSAKGSASGTDRGYHAHLVEFGHVMFLRGKPTGKRVKPHAFLRPALEKGIKYAVEKFKGQGVEE